MSLPSTQQAAEFGAFDTDFSKIAVKEVPLAAPSAGQVVVKNEFASVNPIDWKVYQGGLRDLWGHAFPFRPGYDFSGKVAAVGSDVKDFKVGDHVFGVNWGVSRHDEPDNSEATTGGAFAQYITLPASKVSKVPKGLSGELAAAVPLVGTTAHQSLFRFLQLQKGQRVLVLGGAGAVGAVAVQLAHKAGLWVATTASPRTMDYVKTLGADKIIDYTSAKWSEDPELKGIDAVFDAIGEEGGFANAKKILREDGKWLSIANPDAGFDPAAHAPLSFASFVVFVQDTKVQDELAAALVDGSLKLAVDTTLPFSQDNVHKLYEKSFGGKSLGKNLFKF